MAKSFKNLQAYIQISTAYVNAFLPDGLMKEETMSIFDVETDLVEILVNGSSPQASRFPWPYGHAKHITEHLLQKHHCSLPLLIIRPAAIGSAVREPFPFYGPMKSIPIENLFKMCTISPGSRIFHATENSKSGTNVFDETPVDWVANLILLHAVAGTRGIVNTTSGTFIPRTLDEHFMCYRASSKDAEIRFVEDKSVPQCRWADLWAVCSRNWEFETNKSKAFMEVEGPLSISMKEVDLRAYDQGRKVRVQAEIAASRDSKNKRESRM
jgi:fatty acyl-CoA reductase